MTLLESSQKEVEPAAMSDTRRDPDHPAPDRPDPPPVDNIIQTAVDQEFRLTERFRTAYEKMAGKVVEIHKSQRLRPGTGCSA